MRKLEVLIITPTADTQRCFFMLKRIKTFLPNSKEEERLSALGMLSAERAFKIGNSEMK